MDRDASAAGPPDLRTSGVALSLRLRLVAFLLFAGYGCLSLLDVRKPTDDELFAGILLFLVALSFLRPLPQLVGWLWLGGSILLATVFLSHWFFLAGGRGIGQVLEHSAQVATPLLCFLLLRQARVSTILAVAGGSLSLTFAFHGIRSIGVHSPTDLFSHPTPPDFLEMTRHCLGLSDRLLVDGALLVTGSLDLLAAVLLWLPETRKAALVFMVGWGFLTALAYPATFLDPGSLVETTSRWLPEFLVRAPRWGLALVLLGWEASLRKCSPCPARKR